MLNFLTHTSMIILESQKGETIVARVLTRIIKKSQTRFGVIFGNEAKIVTKRNGININ